MEKSPDAFRTISEVAEWLDVPTHVLRFWESRFTQIKPVKRAGGRRYYRPADMELLGGIKRLLHDDGLTIRGVQKLLREDGVRHVASMSPPLDSAGPDAPANVVRLKPQKAPPAEREPEPAAQAEVSDEVFNRWPFSEDAEQPAPREPEPAPESVAAQFAPSSRADKPPRHDASRPERTEEDTSVEAPEAAPVRGNGIPAHAFTADVPDTDPEDDDPDHAVAPTLLPALGLAGKAHAATLRAVHERLVALRGRMGDSPF